MRDLPAEPCSFSNIGRVPSPGDNVAIAVRTLPAGTRFLHRQLVFEISHTVLEGHRFAIFRIRKGEALLSWGLPFGLALRDLEPGEYVCNEKILRALADRHVDFDLPKLPNFADHRLTVALDERSFEPGVQVRAEGPAPTFRGFARDPSRGAGTRNYVVLLGTNSRTAAFVRALAGRFTNVQANWPNVDGVVALDHTEGGSASRPHNFDRTARTLAGLISNPNVGAALSVDFGTELLSNEVIREALQKTGRSELPHLFFSITKSFEQALDEAARKVESLLAISNGFTRSELPISLLRLALQCGGSDAFSGVSGNPLAGILAREIVAHGGSANLAETSELIGAESYILKNVRDFPTARAFLHTCDRFQEWAGWHGHSAEGNPSGGNMYRGLYNISIKSIGAARKKDPAVRLDYVIDYAQPMRDPGFYFMDSPGNDLESIAGQVAAGCNLIIFTTGNGSITNFPFVPTIKVMTTTRRFNLVRKEMDFNAGRYQDGESLEQLGAEASEYMLQIASGRRSAGERAGHSQVQLWREWRKAGPENPPPGARMLLPQVALAPGLSDLAAAAFRTAAPERTALVLPTSLCAGEIGRMIAERLNATGAKAIALPHTEGCGNSDGESERLFLRTMVGYLAHPLVSRGLLLEHGCEKTHNDAFRNMLRELGLYESNFGFASVQLDGGIDRVLEKAVTWFKNASALPLRDAPFAIGLAGQDLPAKIRDAFGLLLAAVTQNDAIAIIPNSFESAYSLGKLQYGEQCPTAGVYEMDCPTDDLVETLTGLAATGAEILVAYDSARLVPANPLVPTVQIACESTLPQSLWDDVDLLVNESAPAEQVAHRILHLLIDIRNARRQPRSRELSNCAFQVTRGYTGISL